MWDILLNPPAQDPYKVVKAELIRRTSESEQKRLRQLLISEELGDRKPTQLLRRMQQLLGDRQLEPSMLTHLFLQRLPTNVQLILASSCDSVDIDGLEAIADKSSKSLLLNSPSLQSTHLFFQLPAPLPLTPHDFMTLYSNYHSKSRNCHCFCTDQPAITGSIQEHFSASSLFFPPTPSYLLVPRHPRWQGTKVHPTMHLHNPRGSTRVRLGQQLVTTSLPGPFCSVFIILPTRNQVHVSWLTLVLRSAFFRHLLKTGPIQFYSCWGLRIPQTYVRMVICRWLLILACVVFSGGVLLRRMLQIQILNQYNHYITTNFLFPS